MAPPRPKSEASIADILAEASMRFEEAFAALGDKSVAGLAIARLRDSVNTGCTNTGCGKATQRSVESPTA